MNLRLSVRPLLRLLGASVAATVFIGSIGSVDAALAAPKAPYGLDRKAVIARAKSWTTKRVPYSQSGYKGGYRRDCSGFIAYAWNLPENVVTWTLPLVSKRIGKSQLQPGDILLNSKGGRGGRHAVMFEKWANKSKTEYWVLEQTGASGVNSAIRRRMPYPYKFDKGLYKPYRYAGMSRYWKVYNGADRQPVRGYKMIGSPTKSAKKAPAKVAVVAKPTRPTTLTTATADAVAKALEPTERRALDAGRVADAPTMRSSAVEPEPGLFAAVAGFLGLGLDR